MSFMAVFAILLGYPLLRGVFADQYLQEHRLVDWTWSMVAISCAAQVGVAPLIAYYFGRFSTCFLLTNFIVVPLAAIILYLTIVVLVVPALAPLLFKIVGMQNRVLVFIGQLPGASIEGLHPSVVQVVMTYVIIASVWLLCARFRRR
jgi:competence protein ComEC